jgi:hypothetical protein
LSGQIKPEVQIRQLAARANGNIGLYAMLRETGKTIRCFLHAYFLFFHASDKIHLMQGSVH